jgi:hypothetical protein
LEGRKENRAILEDIPSQDSCLASINDLAEVMRSVATQLNQMEKKLSKIDRMDEALVSINEQLQRMQ